MSDTLRKLAQSYLLQSFQGSDKITLITIPLDVRSVYFDVSKEFDRIQHDGLIYYLKRCGVSRQQLFIIQSFLKYRKQQTVLNRKCSTWGEISGGVPQGSFPGPLLFLVFINDLMNDLTCNIKLFAHYLANMSEDAPSPMLTGEYNLNPKKGASI